jgi:hypothetical protein
MTKNIVFWNETPSLVWVTTFQRNLFPKFPKIQKVICGSIIENDEAKTMLTLVCEVTVTGSAPLG